MSQWHASLETLPSREGAKRSTKVESRDDERALVKESRTRGGEDKEQQGANGRAIAAPIQTRSEPHIWTGLGRTNPVYCMRGKEEDG